MVIVLFSSFDPTINELNRPIYRALTSRVTSPDQINGNTNRPIYRALTSRVTSPDQINGNANITTMEFHLRCSSATIVEWSVLYNSCNPTLYIQHERTPACGNSMSGST